MYSLAYKSPFVNTLFKKLSPCSKKAPFSQFREPPAEKTELIAYVYNNVKQQAALLQQQPLTAFYRLT